SGISTITAFDASAHDVRFAGEVRGFEVDQYVPKKEQKKMGRFIHLSIGATEMALQDCGLEWTDEKRERTGVFIGAGIGGLPEIEETHQTISERGPSRVSPFFIPQ